MTDMILKVESLKKFFKTPQGMLHAVDDVSFEINRGKTLGIVGESGCGKSTIGRTILRLTEPTSGRIIFDGSDIEKLTSKQLREKRRDMQIVFQDPFSSIDPRSTVMDTIAEPLKIHKLVTNKSDRLERVLYLM